MPDALPRVAVLASGAGSTMRALIEVQHGGQLPVQFVGLFSHKPAAPALEHALRAGIPVCALSPKGYANARLTMRRCLRGLLMRSPIWWYVRAICALSNPPARAGLPVA